jgi:hypothetical protein
MKYGARFRITKEELMNTNIDIESYVQRSIFEGISKELKENIPISKTEELNHVDFRAEIIAFSIEEWKIFMEELNKHFLECNKITPVLERYFDQIHQNKKIS